MIHQQTTLARECSIEGIGLHTGAKVRMDFKPAPANHGIVFRRIDQDPPVDIPATIDHVPTSSAVPRNTTLEKDGVRIHTVEHVLSALHGLGIHNVLIELNGGEPVEPVDGSCLPFVEALKESGLTKQGDLRKVFEIRKAIQWSDDNGVEIMAVPYDGFRVSFTIRYDNKLIGTQYLSLEISPESFEKDIAPARTFALISDVRQLQESGFIRGGTLENAVVVEDDRIINDTPLRYPDEFVRHKILDLIGDLTLLGQSIRGHIMAVRSGHQANTSFVKKMAQQAQKERLVRDEKGLWGIMEILEIMPHRYPFLLLDRVIEFEDRKRVVAIKNVTINEPFFAGHFPGHPVMPAVLIIEAMAQAGGVLLMNSVGDPSNKLMYFAGVDKARFRKPVRPGDQLRFEVELLRFGGAMCKVQGKAYVEEDLVAEAIILCSIIER